MSDPRASSGTGTGAGTGFEAGVDVTARRFALKLDPPTVVLEYSKTRAAAAGAMAGAGPVSPSKRTKLYHHRIRLKSLDADSDPRRVARKLLKRFPPALADAVPLPQLERLVARLVEHQRRKQKSAAGGDAGEAGGADDGGVRVSSSSALNGDGAGAGAGAGAGDGAPAALVPRRRGGGGLLGALRSRDRSAGVGDADASGSLDSSGDMLASPGFGSGRRGGGGDGSLDGSLEASNDSGRGGGAPVLASATNGNGDTHGDASVGADADAHVKGGVDSDADADRAKPAVTKELVDELSAIGDLQTATQRKVQMAKAHMEVAFEANRLKPGDAGYVHDKVVEFSDGEEDASWDDDDDF